MGPQIFLVNSQRTFWESMTDDPLGAPPRSALTGFAARCEFDALIGPHSLGIRAPVDGPREKELMMRRLIGSIRDSRRELELGCVNGLYFGSEHFFERLEARLRAAGKYQVVENVQVIANHAPALRQAIQEFPGRLTVMIQAVSEAWLLQRSLPQFNDSHELRDLWRESRLHLMQFLSTLDIDRLAWRGPAAVVERRIRTDCEIFVQEIPVGAAGIQQPYSITWIGAAPERLYASRQRPLRGALSRQH